MPEDKRFLGMWLDYIEYAEFFYERFKEATNRFDLFFPNGTNIYQSSKHTPNENKQFEDAFSTRQMYAITAIIYEALAVESFINLLGADKFGAEFYNENLDMLPLTKKLNVITKSRTGKEFPTGDAINKKLSQLKRLRDRLVHNKSIEYKDPNEFEKYYKALLGNEKQNIYELIDDLMGTCKELVGLFYKLEHDINTALSKE